jgi:nitrate reductase NapE component
MKKEEFLKSNLFKFAFVMILVVSIIKIFKGGHAFGVWLYGLLH